MQIREHIADWIYPEGHERRNQAERAADTDALTGLGSRRALDRALSAAEADPGTVIVLFDGNNFGQVNKSAGHSAGDELLREMAAAIRLTAKRFGCAARVFRAGGDEFVVLVPMRWAKTFRDAAEQEFGNRPIANFAISLTGTSGPTLREADRLLQIRKLRRKGFRGYLPGD